MPIDTNTPEGQWFDRLAKKLLHRQDRLSKLRAYYTGQPPLPESLNQIRDVAHDFFKTSRTNFAELVTDSARERMKPVGIRTAAGNDEAGDLQAWDEWIRAGLPVVSADVHQSMLSLGDGYVIVGWDSRRRRPIVTAEDPRQIVTIHDPLDQRRILAGMKMFVDENEGVEYAYMHLPGKVLVAEREAKQYASTQASLFNAHDWTWNTDLSAPLPRGFEDVVAIVRFRNREGVSEFERHIDVLDRINRTVLRRMVITTFQAFKQRAVKGDLPEVDQAGNLIDYDTVLKSGPDALWMLPPDVEIWESGQVDLAPILASVKADVLFLAAVTRTPLSMLTPDAAAQSAEGASLQREGLVFRTEDRIARAADGWSQVVSLMFRFAGDRARADSEQVHVMWAPVERYSLSEAASAWSQLQGLPFETKLRTVFRMSPDEIDRAKAELAQDQLNAVLLQPAAPVVPASAEPTV